MAAKATTGFWPVLTDEKSHSFGGETVGRDAPSDGNNKFTEGSDMFDQAQNDTTAIAGQSLIRIIAHRVQWPAISNPSTKLRWDAKLEDGTLICAKTEHALAEGALALIGMGHDPQTLVSMRHAGAAFDSWVPQTLAAAAAPAVKRATRIAALHKQMSETADA